MPTQLTPKQEAFCLAYLKTGNASEAYRQSYNAAAMKPATINRKATEVMANGMIAARLAELRAPAVEATQVTLESHLTRLARIGDAAMEAGQFAAAVTAEVSRGKAAGLYDTKTDAKLIVDPGPNWRALFREDPSD